MANEYSPILISEASSLLPKPIAPQRKSILPVKVPVPAPRSSLESKTERISKSSDTIRGFGCNAGKAGFQIDACWIALSARL